MNLFDKEQQKPQATKTCISYFAIYSSIIVFLWATALPHTVGLRMLCALKKEARQVNKKFYEFKKEGI